MELKPLTPEEEAVIADKGTEPLGSGEYDQLFQPGIFARQTSKNSKPFIRPRIAIRRTRIVSR